MELFFNFLKTDTFLIIILVCLIVLFFLYIANSIRLYKLRKSYKSFMKKLGDGNDVCKIISDYMETIDNVKGQNDEILRYLDKIEKEKENCLQKVGLVRYNAFKDTGSDLSFALAILDDNNNGIVLNGIYSREMSNIYAKSIQDGKSNNKLSDEEIEAIKIAINS